ncbi:MAG: secondary thiamine-phosphate synthase enzyme YjbQ [Candidatus Acidiferrales bacterium]
MSAPARSTHGTRNEKLAIKTSRRTELRKITREVAEIVARHGPIDGVCHVYVPHTTAGITINEGADPDVAHDIESTFDRMVPREAAGYRHAEGNSDSHVKTAMVGTSQTVLIENGRLVLGRWQAIFLCEFDGPRTREVLVRVVPVAPA